MARSYLERLTRTRKVTIDAFSFVFAFQCFLNSVHLILCSILKVVDYLAEFFLLVIRDILKLCKKVIQNSFFSQEFYPECFQLFLVLGLECFRFSYIVFNLIYHLNSVRSANLAILKTNHIYSFV